MPEGLEGLLVGGACLAICSPIEIPRPRLSAVVHCLGPDLAAYSMDSKRRDLFGQPIRVKPFDGFDDSSMKRAASFLEQAAVRHLVRQGMLERVFELWEESRLVEELRSLQLRERLTNGLLRLLGDRLQQCRRHVLASHRGRLQQSLVLWSQAVDAR